MSKKPRFAKSSKSDLEKLVRFGFDRMFSNRDIDVATGALLGRYRRGAVASAA